MIVGEDGSEALGPGTIRAIFQSSGNVAQAKDKLKSLVMLGVMATAVALSILPAIPSGPVDLDGSRLAIKSKTSSSV